MSYFDDGATVPSPFNLVPTAKTALKPCAKKAIKEEDMVRRLVKLNFDFNIVMINGSSS